MKRTLLALSAVALLTTVEGCGCCRGLWRRDPQPVAVPSAPAAPVCAPDQCGGCDACAGAPAFGTSSYGAPSSGAYTDPSGGYTPMPTLPSNGANGYNSAPLPQ